MIGILTTYNQTCGLAKYAEQLFGHIERSDYLILAEQVPATSLLSSDQPNTIRCWKKFDTSYLELEKVIFDRGIKLLHLNCQHSFFKAQVFCETLKRLRSNGVKVILHVHAPDTHCENLKRLISSVDHFIVNTPENKSEMILSGAPSEEITVLEMGVPVFANLSKAEAREKLGLAQTARVIATPGFVRTHKGVAEVLPEIAALNKMGFPIEYHLLGASHPDDQDQKYINDLDQQAINLGIKDLVHFQNTFATDKDLELGLLASDAVVLNYQSKNYESSMAISLAFAAGKPILTSTAPTFARFAGSVFHCTPGFPLRVALYNVFNNKQFADHLSNAAKLWAVNNSWTNVAADLSATYDRLLKQQTKQVNIVRQAENPGVTRDNVVCKTKSHLQASKTLRVAFLVREDMFVNPGGDTTAISSYLRELKELGVTVEAHTETPKNLDSYDLAHLCNMCLPEQLEKYSRACVEANVPYVITTLYEHWPCYAKAMSENIAVINAYLQLGQPKHRWDELVNCPKNGTTKKPFDNSYAVNNASRLLASGKLEEDWLMEQYPQSPKIQITPFASAMGEVTSDNGKLFFDVFGIKDYVLCVGRLETRKNQLMLLKALEDSSLSIVFLNGGVDSHPSYLNAAKAFKRLGKTYFLGRLTEELLLSAYAGARVHALPSWCDLPGLVTLDAAKVGTPVVCSKYTTVPDYLGDDAFYCDPSDSRDIFEKVQIAYQQPKNKNLIEKSNSFSWKHSAKELVGVYQEVIAENKSNNIPSVKTNPKLSVLLCSYNRERKVEKCLAALAAQSLASSEYEVICVNDGSTDGTGDLMKQYLETNQGVYIEHKTNRALAAARNSAIEAARGDYLVFINDDTYPTADFLVKHLEALERKNDTYAAIVGDLPFVEGLNDRILSKTLLDHDLYFCFNKLDRIKTNPFWAFVTGNLSISKKAFTETGIRFDESFLRYGYEDLECGYRLSKLGLKVYYVPEAIALHDHKITIAEFARRAENNAINMLQCAVKHKGDKLFTSTLFGVPEITKQVLDFWRKSSLNTLPTISNLESQISQLEDEKVSVVKARGVDVTGLISNVAIGIESLGALVRQLTYVKTLEEHSEMYQSLIGEDHKSSIVKRALV